MDEILLQWPWLGLVLGVLGLAFLFVSFLRRRSDDRFSVLVWMPLFIYMLHQFEEHGIDLFGNHYAFLAFFCEFLGFPGEQISHCPADPAFIFAVNVGTVWIAGLISGFFGVKKPLLTGTMIGAIAINGLVHILNLIKLGHYNPGLATGVVLFLPFSMLSYRFMMKGRLLNGKQLFGCLFGGVIIHAVLLGSLLAKERGFIDEPMLLGIQILNGFMPFAISGAFGSRS